MLLLQANLAPNKSVWFPHFTVFSEIGADGVVLLLSTSFWKTIKEIPALRVVKSYF